MEKDPLVRLDTAMAELQKIMGQDDLDDLHEKIAETAMESMAADGLEEDADLYEKLATLFEDELRKRK